MSTMTASPLIGLAERQRQLGLGRLEIAAGQDLAQIDGLALGVGQLDADGVAAGNDGDAGGDRAHRAGDVVGKADDARRFDAGRRLQLVEGDDGAGPDMDDLALDAEILQHAFQQPRILLQRVLRQAGVAHHVLRLRQEMQRRHLEAGRSRSARSAPRAARARRAPAAAPGRRRVRRRPASGNCWTCAAGASADASRAEDRVCRRRHRRDRP